MGRGRWGQKLLLLKITPSYPPPPPPSWVVQPTIWMFWPKNNFQFLFLAIKHPTDSWTTYRAISHLLTYGGSLTGSQASSSRPPLFGNARRKVALIAKIIPAEITHKNVKGPPTFQELVADIFWKKPLMWFTVSPRRELRFITIHLYNWWSRLNKKCWYFHLN